MEIKFEINKDLEHKQLTRKKFAGNYNNENWCMIVITINNNDNNDDNNNSNNNKIIIIIAIIIIRRKTITMNKDSNK